MINTLFSYVVYAAFLFLGMDFRAANFLAMVAGILFSFRTQGRLVFRNEDNRLFGRYVLSWMLIYLCNIAFIGQLVHFGIDAYAAGFIALPFSTVLSYFVQKHVVFNRRSSRKIASGKS